jgi:hypothetical protein
MHMDEDRGQERANGRDDREGRGEKIGIGGGDDAVTRIQLAARWSEAFSPATDDSLVGILKRFRVAYEYLDAVIHGVEPIEPELSEASQSNARLAQPAATPPQYSAPNPPAAPSGGEPEPRPWS